MKPLLAVAGILALATPSHAWIFSETGIGAEEVRPYVIQTCKIMKDNHDHNNNWFWSNIQGRRPEGYQVLNDMIREFKSGANPQVQGDWFAQYLVDDVVRLFEKEVRATCPQYLF